MGIIPTVIRRPDSLPSSNISGEEKKYLAGINSRIDDLKMQNLENAKFLRGISRKIENELTQMKELESGKSIEMFDDSSIMEGLERIENSVKEINASPIMDELDKLNKMNTSLSEFNPDVILLEIDKLNRTLKEVQPDNLTSEISKVNDNVSRLDTEAVMNELNRVEAIISEINSNAVLAELDRMRQLIESKNSNEMAQRVETKLNAMVRTDYSSQLDELKAMMEKNSTDIAGLGEKVDRISTMPASLRSIITSENEKNLKSTDDHINDLNNTQNKKIDGIKSLVGFTLWLSLLSVVLMIVNILGII